MPKPSNRLAKRLSTFRAGNLEDQRDTHRENVYIDPNRYFRMESNFGLHRDNWDRLARGAPQVLEGVFTKEQERATRRRTRGIAGPNPDKADDMAGIMIVEGPGVQQRVRSQPPKAKGRGKKRY
jgi:hypothetical protein